MPENIESFGTSKSAVSRRFVDVTSAQFEKLMSQSITSLDIQVLMLDGVAVPGHTIIVALGFDSGGNKHVLWFLGGRDRKRGSLQEPIGEFGGARFARESNAAIRHRWQQGIGKGRKRQLIQRCQVHKCRNVEEHLPEEEKKSIETKHPGAAASLREGMDETLTVLRFGLPEALEKTLVTTNAIENLNGTLRHVSLRVENWQDGTMILRWFAIAMVEAQKGFRRLKGYKGMKTLARVLRRHDAELERQVAPAMEAA